MSSIYFKNGKVIKLNDSVIVCDYCPCDEESSSSGDCVCTGTCVWVYAEDTETWTKDDGLSECSGCCTGACVDGPPPGSWCDGEQAEHNCDGTGDWTYDNPCGR